MAVALAVLCGLAPGARAEETADAADTDPAAGTSGPGLLKRLKAQPHGPAQADGTTPADEIAAQRTGDRTLVERLDDSHDVVHGLLQAPVDYADQLFVTEGEQRIPRRNSRFEIRLELKLEEDQGPELSVDPDFEGEFDLPNVERKLNVFIDSSLSSELPSADPQATDSVVRIGLFRDREMPYGMKLRTAAGLRARWPPQVFGEVALGRPFIWTRVGIRPEIKGEWRSEEGWGMLPVMYADCWPTEDVLFRSISAAKWTEQTDGVEWEQSLLAGWVRERPEGARVRSTKRRSLHRAIALKGTVFGHNSSDGVVDEYRAGAMVRFPLRKQYLYFELIPELRWINREIDKDDSNWDVTPAIRFGLHILFWGTPER